MSKVSKSVPKRLQFIERNVCQGATDSLNLSVLSLVSLNESMRTGKRTPRAKANPIVRIIRIVGQQQINQDQALSCLKEEK